MKTSIAPCLCSVLGVLVALLLMFTPAYAVDIDSYTIFELEADLGNANAVNDTGAGLPDDWEDILNNVDGSLVDTGIISDPSPETIYTGGSKDTLPLDQLGWKNGTVPDKSEILNAYAAAYDAGGGELHIYFGADRFANVGDTFLGFWFFQDIIDDEANGTFSGSRTPGDVLVLLNFPQSVKDDPLVEVYTWDPTCAKKVGPNPAVGQCAATNLKLEAHNTGNDAAVCGGTGAEDVCGNTNNGLIPSPWPYEAKTGEIDEFPFETFFEGGINLGALGLDGCFSSFMAESRASASPTAQLKDFVLESFELCSIEITKLCGQAQLNATEDGFIYDVSGTVTNTGFGTLYDLVVTDTTVSQVLDDTIAELAAGNSVGYSGQIESTLNGLATNEVEVVAAPIDGGVKTVSDLATDPCESLSLSPVIDVTKNCGIDANGTEGVYLDIGEDEFGDPAIILKVDFEGMVCNTTEGGGADGPIGLTNVTVVDDSGTPSDLTDDQILLGPISLAPGDCQSYTGTYTPRSLPANGVPIDDPSLVEFSDTVTATGTAPLGFGDALDTASQTCPICISEE